MELLIGVMRVFYSFVACWAVVGATSWSSLTDLLSNNNVCFSLSSEGLLGSSGRPSANNPAYRITTNTSLYYLQQKIKVTLACETAVSGFLVQVQNIDTGRAVGSFEAVKGDSRLYNCSHGVHNTFGMQFSDPQNEQELFWKAPSTDVGNLHIRVMFFASDHQLINVTSHRISKGFQPIDLSGCGTQKGCFRQATTLYDVCDYDTCEYILTYQRAGSVAHFELMAKADWVAVGFSSDDLMGGDDILMCAPYHGEVAVEHYWTEVEYVAPKKQTNNPLTNVSTHLSNRRVACRFTRSLKVYNDDRSLDLNNEWYQLYAWGPTHERHTIIRHKRAQPPTSQGLITLIPSNNVINSALRLMIPYFYITFITSVTILL